jgi:subtilase family serine protease
VRLLVRVDPFDLLAERREDNNAAPLVLRVRPSDLPNLTVSGADVTIAPDPPVEGESATLAAVVRNTGADPAGAFAVRFVVGDPDRDGAVVGEALVEGLAAGEARSVTLAWPRVDVRGSLGLYVIADAGAGVDESNEEDNRAFRPFSANRSPRPYWAARPA